MVRENRFKNSLKSVLIIMLSKYYSALMMATCWTTSKGNYDDIFKNNVA